MLKGFFPNIDKGTRVLILGSMPSQKSLDCQEYYGNKQNAFWWLMGELLGASPELSYQKRMERTAKKGIALWDVIQSCEREGSLDSAIVPETVVVNDFEKLLGRYSQIEAIFFNGGTAQQLFRRYAKKNIQPSMLPPMLHKLPSTSPANARLSRQQKLEQWKVILDYL